MPGKQNKKNNRLAAELGPDQRSDPGYATINGRRYPSYFAPGSHWAVDGAWQILDELPDGAISDQQRALLAGLITAKLIDTRREAANLYTSYIVAADGKSITCMRCGMTSYNAGDVAHLYCRHCKQFHREG